MSKEKQTKISIWDAKNKLSYNEPLLPNDPMFVDTSMARGDFSLDRLYRGLHIDNNGQLQQPPKKQYILFTGHRGCGKSTELLRVTDFLHDPKRFYVVHLDCLQKLDINNLKYSDVLLALAAELLTKLKNENGISIEDVHLTRLENWFKERVETHAKTKDLSVEIKAGAKIKTGLPWLVELFTQLTSKVNIGSTYREELRKVVRNSYSEFAEAFNQLIRVVEDKINEQNLGKRVLFTIDGTDRLNSEDAPQFFVNDVHQLTLISSLFIYCAPIHLLHADNQLNANYSQIFRLPMIKIRDKKNEKIEDNYEVMRQMVRQRVPEYLFDSNETIDYLICYSGGHLRDLIRLLNVSINFAENEIIDKRSSEKAVKQIANEYRRFINSDQYSILVKIDKNPEDPDDFTGEETSLMLYNLVLLEYNDYFWKSHPVIETLAAYQRAKRT